MTDKQRAEPVGTNPRPLHNPRLAEIVEQNIETLVTLKRHRSRQRTLEDRAADAITGFSGSMRFVYFHLILFAGWMLLGNGLFGVPRFDPYPYQLLTMAVSLEAIFLSTFVLVSQNRMAIEADRRADLDLHVDLLTEHEITRALKMLDAIQDKLGIANDEDRELRELEDECTPTAVLEQLEWAAAQRDR
jgi:uncharacterized membrane protein